MNARVSIIISGPVVNEPTTAHLSLTSIPEETNGTPPLTVAGSTGAPISFESART